ncbi:MAG: hypothetical protein AB1779_04200 [Candidatus Thermoplasmatota archaeon]
MIEFTNPSIAIFSCETICGFIGVIAMFKFYKFMIRNLAERENWQRVGEYLEREKINHITHPEFGRVNATLAIVIIISITTSISFLIGLILLNGAFVSIFSKSASEYTISGANSSLTTGGIFIFISILFFFLEYILIIRNALTEDVIQ